VIASCDAQHFREEDADHPSRPERPCDPPTLLLLEKLAAHPDRSRARPRNRRLSRSEHAKKSNCPPLRAAKIPPSPPCRPVGSICTLLTPGRTTPSPTSKKQLHAWTITPEGTEVMRKPKSLPAASTPDELSAKSMEAPQSPRPVLIGEVVDVHRPISAASISSGPGPPARPPDERCKISHFQSRLSGSVPPSNRASHGPTRKTTLLVSVPLRSCYPNPSRGPLRSVLWS